MDILALLASFSFSYHYRTNAVQGSGKPVTEVRSVKDFHGINLSKSVKATLTRGPFKVQVRADDNLQRLIKTDVKKGILIFSYEGGFDTKNPVELLIQAPHIDAITLTGATEVTGKDFDEKKLAIEMDGGTSLNLSQLKIQDLDIDVSGAGELTFHKLTSTRVDVDASGGSEIKFDAFTTQSLNLDVSGGTEIYLAGSSETSTIESVGGATVNANQLATKTVKLEAAGGSEIFLTRASNIQGELEGGATLHAAKTARLDLERSTATTLIQEE